MSLGNFKVLPFVFLIFLSCYVTHVIGKSVIDLEERNQKTSSSSELLSRALEETVHEESVTVARQGICEDDTCQNNGTCMVIDGEALCNCPLEFTGSKCEIHKCENITCQNYGTCKLKDGKTICECTIEYTGSACEKHICDDIFCQNNGTCKMKEGKAMCECPDEYGGEECDIHKCGQLMCQNGGTCYQVENNDTCFCEDEDTGFFSLIDCEKHKCDGVMCPNGKKCLLEDWELCDCLDGYTGFECEEHMCDDITCLNNGTCKLKDGKAMCECPDEYGGEECEKHKCGQLMCQNGGTCKVTENNDTCLCKDEDTGLFISWIDCKKHNCADVVCQNGKKCMLEDRKACECPDGYTGLECEKQDPCYLNPCQNGGICIAFGEEATCVCKDGFTGRLCQTECSHIKCAIDGKCIIKFGEAVCDCSEGHRGHICGTDECSLMNAHCENDAKCRPKHVPCYCFENDDGKFCSIPGEFVQYLCNKNCKGTGGFCMLEKNKTTECLCPEGTEYKLDTGCTSLTGKCLQYMSGCEETGGFCVIGESKQLKCNCPKGTVYVSGSGCQNTCDLNPCENDGICRIDEGQTTCFCKEPYAGKFCSSRMDSKYSIFAFATIWVLLGLVVVLAACLLYHCACSVRK